MGGKTRKPDMMDVAIDLKLNAKIYAETVIRQRKEAINVRRFGVKMGALAAKIEGAART